jgi:hypothetical protein
MTASVPFPLPPGRALSDWRQELASFQPRRLRLAHLLLHRVEALVRVARRLPVDSFQAALLRQLATTAPLDRLRVDRELLDRWMRDLSTKGLVAAPGDWRLTERGRRALESNAYTSAVEERRVFTFLEEEAAGRPPRFLALHGPAVALAPPPGWRFDAEALAACVRRPEEWKKRHDFPTDVEAFLAPPGPAERTATDWRRLLLDRPEQILLVFISERRVDHRRWLGFAVRAEDWVLQTKAPTLTLGEEAEEVLPDLGVVPAPEVWSEAWRAWCRQRGLPSADADACRIEPAEEGVRVVAPRTLTGRLGGERTDAWLLAGTRRTRVASPLEIVEEA